jgi:hypothetical protein
MPAIFATTTMHCSCSLNYSVFAFPSDSPLPALNKCVVSRHLFAEGRPAYSHPDNFGRGKQLVRPITADERLKWRKKVPQALQWVEAPSAAALVHALRHNNQ